MTETHVTEDLLAGYSFYVLPTVAEDGDKPEEGQEAPALDARAFMVAEEDEEKEEEATPAAEGDDEATPAEEVKPEAVTAESEEGEQKPEEPKEGE